MLAYQCQAHATLLIPFGEHGSLSRPVCKNAGKLLNEFRALTARHLDGHSATCRTPSAPCAMLRKALHLLGAFQQRVMDRVASEPLSLMWLSWGDASTPCPRRLAEASRLLMTHADQLHNSSRKLVVAFREELEYCVSSEGAYCTNLYGPFCGKHVGLPRCRAGGCERHDQGNLGHGSIFELGRRRRSGWQSQRLWSGQSGY